MVLLLRQKSGGKQKVLPAFKVVKVFDVSQTDGKEFLSIGVNKMTGEVSRFDDFMEALKETSKIAKSMRIEKSKPTEFASLQGITAVLPYTVAGG